MLVGFNHEVMQTAGSQNEVDNFILSESDGCQSDPVRHYAKGILHNTSCSGQTIIKNSLWLVQVPLWIRFHDVLG